MLRAPHVRDLWPPTAPPVPFLWPCARASACRAAERVFTRITTSARVSCVLRSPAAVIQCVCIGFCGAVLGVRGYDADPLSCAELVNE